MTSEHGLNESLEPLNRPGELSAVVRNVAVAKSLQAVGGRVLVGN